MYRDATGCKESQEAHIPFRDVQVVLKTGFNGKIELVSARPLFLASDPRWVIERAYKYTVSYLITYI